MLQFPLKTAGVFPLSPPFVVAIGVGTGVGVGAGVGAAGWTSTGGGPVGCADATAI